MLKKIALLTHHSDFKLIVFFFLIIYIFRLMNLFLFLMFQNSQQFLSQQLWDDNLTKLIQSNKISLADDVCAALNTMQTQLNTLNTLRPLSNKLLLVPQVFISSEFSETDTNTLNEVMRRIFIITAKIRLKTIFVSGFCFKYYKRDKLSLARVTFR